MDPLWAECPHPSANPPCLVFFRCPQLFVNGANPSSYFLRSPVKSRKELRRNSCIWPTDLSTPFNYVFSVFSRRGLSLHGNEGLVIWALKCIIYYLWQSAREISLVFVLQRIDLGRNKHQEPSHHHPRGFLLFHVFQMTLSPSPITTP